MSTFVVNKHHMRELLIYFYHLKKSAAEAHRLLAEAYGEAALSESSCREWLQRFKNREFDVEDRKRSGRPKALRDAEMDATNDNGSAARLRNVKSEPADEMFEYVDVKQEHERVKEEKLDADDAANVAVKAEAGACEKKRKYFGCGLCTRVYPMPSLLKKYMKTHCDEKPIGCADCGKRFKHQHSLNVHMLVHAGEKPHECDLCHKRFTCMTSLRVHLSSHTDERTPKCDECGKTFKQSSYLKSHMRLHKKQFAYQCSVCDKKCVLSTHLKAHMFTHTGKKPHKCKICGKRFTEVGSLNRHVLAHASQELYRCTICDKAYKYACSLKTHKLSHAAPKRSRAKTKTEPQDT